MKFCQKNLKNTKKWPKRLKPGKGPKTAKKWPKRLKPGKGPKTAKKGLKKAFFGVSLSIW
jgi:hypothetical protein